MNPSRRCIQRPALRRAAAWVAVASLLLSLAPASAQQAPAPPEPPTPDPAVAVPANALFVATLDLRPGTPNMKVLLSLLKPQERAVGEALLMLLGQVGLSALGAGLDVEKDILPWVGRRVHLVGLPAAEENKPPRMVVLAEVRDPGAAAAAVTTLLARVAEATQGKVDQRPIGETVLRSVSMPNRGHIQVALRGDALAASRDIGAVEAWIQAPPAAPGAEAAWIRALRSVPSGVLTVGVSPALLGKQAAMGAALGLAGVAVSTGADPAGGRLEIAADLGAAPKDSIGDRVSAGLGQVKLTGEALSVVPATALGAVTIAAPASILKAAGVEPLLYMALGQMLGQKGQALMPRLRPVLEQVLAGEVTVALLGLTPQPQAVAILATPDADAAAGALAPLREALGAIPGLKAGDAAPGLAGFSFTLPGKAPRTLHVSAAGRWLLLGSDAEALKPVAEAAAGGPGKPGLAASDTYQRVHQQLGDGSLLELYLDTRALGRAASEFGLQMAMRESLPKAPAEGTAPAAGAAPADGTAPAADPAAQAASILGRVPPAYFTRLTDAFLLPYSGTGLGLSMRDRIAHLTLFQQVDWQSVSTATASLPMMAAIGAAVAIPVFHRSRGKAQAAACQANLKQLTMALMLYAEEHGGRLPAADKWREALLPYVENEGTFRCPMDTAGHPSSYAMNQRLSGRKLDDVLDQETVIALFDSTAEGANPADVGGSLPQPPRHEGAHNFAFLDGHVESLPEVEAGAWVPEVRPAPQAPKAAAPAPAAKKPATKPAVKKPAAKPKAPTKTRRR